MKRHILLSTLIAAGLAMVPLAATAYAGEMKNTDNMSSDNMKKDDGMSKGAMSDDNMKKDTGMNNGSMSGGNMSNDDMKK